MSTDKILDRLAKLKAMREGEAKLGNIEAAEAFASMINRLLLEHELNEADIDMHRRDDDPIVEILLDRDAAGIKKVTNRVAWQEALARIVAKANLCKTVVHSGSNIITFVGTHGHAAMSEYAYGVLAAAAERLSVRERTQWVEAQRRAGTYEGTTAGFRDSWFAGFIKRIGERFDEERKRAVEQTANSSTALIRLDQALVKAQDYIKNQMDTRKVKSHLRTGANDAGYAAGTDAANRMNIGQRGVQAGSGQKQGLLK